MSNSYATGNVSGNNSVGGLVGYTHGGLVNNSYATGNVSGTSYVGGLVGNNSGIVSTSYATGNVSGSGDYVGGLVGSVTVSDMGGGAVFYSFYDRETSGQSDNTGKGEPKTTAEMKSYSTFISAGWDFLGETANGNADIWGINSSENNGYPFLWWQGFTHKITLIIVVTQSDHGIISPDDPVVDYGDDQELSITPDKCYHVATLTVDSSPVAPAESYTFEDIQADHTLTATFALTTYNLTYTAGTGGTINGTTPQTVDCGANGSAVTAVADSNYHFVNWSDSSTDNPRTDTNVTANITVAANFAIDTSPTPTPTPTPRPGGGSTGTSSTPAPTPTITATPTPTVQPTATPTPTYVTMPNPTPTPSSGGMVTGTMAGIIAGIFDGLAIVTCLVILLGRRK
jgi:hypothetical protein